VFAIEPAVTAAIITAAAVLGGAIVAGPVMYVIKRFDQRNSDQHDEAARQRQENAHLLRHVAKRVDDNGKLLSDHLSWHAHADGGQEVG